MDFIINKVNGEDVSKSAHKETIEALKSAKEPIVVELLRRAANTQMRPLTPTMASVATQTDLDIYTYPEYQIPSPPLPPFWDTHTSGSENDRVELFYDNNHARYLSGHLPAHDNDLCLDEQNCELEYEEVILHRDSCSQKLGLTLCYGSLDDEVTEIFISEIERNGVAAQDGRIHEGDQILQINGTDVFNREQAIQLFSSQKLSVHLLVTRPHIQFDDGFMESRSFFDDSKLSSESGSLPFNHLLHSRIDEEEATTDTGTTNTSHKHEKDSGVGRTDESTRNDESSEQEDSSSSPTANVSYTHSHTLTPCDHRNNSNDSFTSNDIPDFEESSAILDYEECDNTPVIPDRTFEPHKTFSSTTNTEHLKSELDLDQELAILNREMEKIQLECQKIVQSHIREQNHVTDSSEVTLNQSNNEVHRSPRIVPRMGTRLDYSKQGLGQFGDADPQYEMNHKSSPPNSRISTLPRSTISRLQHAEKELTISSAYSTGESVCSTPLIHDLNNKDSTVNIYDNIPVFSIAPSDYQSDTEKQTQTVSPSKSPIRVSPLRMNLTSKCVKSNDLNTSSNHKSPGDRQVNIESNINRLRNLNESLQDLYARYADVMYTNEANLQHTIAIQQKLFQQQLTYKGRKRIIYPDLSKENNKSLNNNNNLPRPSATEGETPIAMEWVVKRRPDGSRYITRRPVRNKLLKERAKKVAEERCGVTTDEDAMSELKVGRYWSKEDRKRHVEKSKEQKKRKEQLIQKQKCDSNSKEENLNSDKNTNILELSHKKILRQKGKKVLDNFVTVQEMLAHGSRICSGKTYNPLLSVTTV